MKLEQVKKFFSVIFSVVLLLSVQQVRAQSTTSVSATDDFGNSCAAASAAELNTTVNGEINFSGDYDYFKVEVTSSGTLTAYTTGATDTFGYVKDTGCNDIVTDDNSSGGGESL